MGQGIWRNVAGRPKLVLAIAIGILCYFVFRFAGETATRLLTAWNVGAGFFVVTAGIHMMRADDNFIRAQAQKTDEGRLFVLLSALVAAVVSLLAIVVELSRIKDDAASASFYVGLSAITILVSWSFIQVIFTEHYAHEYYMRTEDGRRRSTVDGDGLEFPKEKKPDYVDFLYFTVTIGVANQTADIAVSSREMRVLVLIHSVISYFFNTAVLALSINIVSSIL